MTETAGESTTEFIDELLSSARRRGGADAAELYLDAIDALMAEQLIERAQQEAEQVQRPESLPAELQLRYAIARARLDLEAARPLSAQRWLTGTLARSATPNSSLGQEYYLLLGRCFLLNRQVTDAIDAFLQLTPVQLDDENSTVYDELWQALSLLSNAELNSLAATASTYELRGWIELARVYRQDQFSMRSQLDAIAQWRSTWSRHSAARRIPQALADLENVWESRPTRIALILPLQESAGNAIQEGFLGAYYQALSISREVPTISIFDSSNTSVIYGLYNEAVENGADLVIGPLNKQLVNQLQELPELPVPTLALNYADNNERLPANLFQFGLAPEDEIRQAARLAWAEGHRNAAILTPGSADYQRLQNVFRQAWTELGGQIVSESTFIGDADYADVIKRLMAIDSSEARANRLLDLLPRSNIEFTPRRRSDIDFIFLMANPRQGRQINPTLAFYFAGDIPVFATPSINDGLDNRNLNRDLDGIVFTIEPWILDNDDPLKQEVTANLRRAQGPLQRLRAMGIDAFRLYPRLQQLAHRQITSLQGTTGELSMSEDRRIQRNLAVARFVDGVATPYPGAGMDSDD